MLRLVHPAPAGKGTRPSSRRLSSALFPTADERTRIKAALTNLRRAYGGWDVLAAVMRVGVKTIEGARAGKSYAVAVLAARAAGVTVEEILSPGVRDARCCALGGRKGAR